MEAASEGYSFSTDITYIFLQASMVNWSLMKEVECNW